MVQLSTLEQSPPSGKPEAGELEHFIVYFISNEPCFLPPGLLCSGAKGRLVPSPSVDLTRSAVIKTTGYERGGLAAPGLPLAFTEAGAMVPHLCCFIKAKRRKTPGLDGKQDEQVTDGTKEGREHPTDGTAGRCRLSRGPKPQKGERDRQDSQDAIKKNEL